MVIVEQSSQPFTLPDGPEHVLGGPFRRRRRREQPVADSLMVALQVVVQDVFGDERPEVPLTERGMTRQYSARHACERRARSSVLANRATTAAGTL
jgi:hypothetical protein